jgi:hypothetical protein
MARLTQIIAVEKGIKSRSLQELTEAHNAPQKPAHLAGIARTYRPKDGQGEPLPPESTQVQIKSDRNGLSPAASRRAETFGVN